MRVHPARATCRHGAAPPSRRPNVRVSSRLRRAASSEGGDECGFRAPRDFPEIRCRVKHFRAKAHDPPDRRRFAGGERSTAAEAARSRRAAFGSRKSGRVISIRSPSRKSVTLSTRRPNMASPARSGARPSRCSIAAVRSASPTVVPADTSTAINTSVPPPTYAIWTRTGLLALSE